MKQLMSKIGVLTVVLGGLVGTAGQARAATINASSCSQADVQAAISSAVNGDIVAVPAGSCTWTAVVNLGSKALTLRGAGVGQTNITHAAAGSQVKLIQFTQHATIPTRITGFSFSGGTYDRRFIGCSGSYTSSPMRIDNNSFTSGSGSILVDIFGCRGLIDHNTFAAVANSEMLHIWGPGTSGWSAEVTPGSSNALYVENNIFNNLTNGDWGAQSAIQSYDAARTVVRYNTFNNNQVDQHGGSNIGARWFEFYENTFFTTAGYNQDKYFDIRAGSGVVFNNHKTGAASNAMIIFRDESRAGDARYDVGEGINRTHWSPAYVWGNDSSMRVGIGVGSTRIAQGTNFIISVTQPSSLKCWQTAASNANTTCNYVPFTYPYPLDANGMPNPSGSSTTASTTTGTPSPTGGSTTPSATTCP